LTVANQRGFAPSFVRELHKAGKIGIYLDRGERRVAFPVYNGEEIVGVQYRVPPRNEDGKARWFYEPSGNKATPLVFGSLTPGQRVVITESIFDGLAFMERTGTRDGIIIARGAENGTRAAALIPAGSTAYVLTQNDRAGATFEKAVVENTPETVRRVRTPAPFKDLNEWTLAGATASDLEDALRAGKRAEEEPAYPWCNSQAAQQFQKEIDLQSSGEVLPVELPPPPPLTLLPLVLQEYVHAAAESLNVDVGFIFLPMLSALGGAIGNSRSILLKPGYIQPPNIWTGILGPSGTLKSASIETACFANDERERELDQQNRVAQEIYAEDLAQWESQKKSLRGRKPDPPEIQTCKMDDLTLEALADRLQSNPRGVLVAKDEISGFFESFDLYRKNKGADVSRWLSPHTGAHFGIDRRTDNRHQRIWLPRVCITGGVQPKVFKRLMREDYFERGLPARFIFAAPPCKLKWSNSIIPNDLIQAVRELFEQLWLLQPNHDDHKQPAPMLLRLTGEAREEYIAFYNQCGASAAESSENEAAAWSKLPGYGGRFALEGQLTCNPQPEKVTGEVMRAACKLARWSGNETTRIYAQLSETPAQRAQRELIEFIERRGGTVSVRDLMQLHWPLRDQRDEAERQLGVLVRNGFGKWVDDKGNRGPAAHKFQMYSASTSTGFGKIRGENEKSVDVDAGSSQKTTPAEQPNVEPVPVPVQDTEGEL
jgi:hypothetical protein